MSICTKTGDKGDTSLYTGQRIAKNSLRVESYGSVDEINSALASASNVSRLPGNLTKKLLPSPNLLSTLIVP